MGTAMILRQLLTLFFSFCLLPAAFAGPAADFAAASRTQQIVLLQQWAAAPDASRLSFLMALRKENVVLDEHKQPFSVTEGRLTPLDAAVQPAGRDRKSVV